MKFNKLFLGLFLLGITSIQAQQKTHLSLKDAVSMALSKSDAVTLANTKAATKNYETQSVKMNQYPDLKISGQYLRLTEADVNLKGLQEPTEEGASTESGATSPKVNQLMLGQASISMPIFSGFKIKNSIVASENLYKAEVANSKHTKEETAMKVVQYYADLYKAQQSVKLFKESLKSGQQRVTDFIAMEKNGIIARNDLLKAQLQVSKIQLSLNDAEKNVRLIRYALNTVLKLDPETAIEVSTDNIDPNLLSYGVKTEAEALQSRKDLEALSYLEKANKSNIKVAQSGYYPAIALTGGYLALDLQNVVRVENAMNIGIGVSYNLSSVFKNGKEVKAAKSRTLEIQQEQAILTDAIKNEIVRAREDYDLSLKQDKVYTQAVAQADENYRIVKDKYDNGLSDTNDLLEADVENLSAKINQTYAKANVVLKYYELLDASGQLTESFNLTQN